MTEDPSRRSRPVATGLLFVALWGCAAGSPDAAVVEGDDLPVSLVLTLAAGAPGPIWVRESDAESQPRWVAVRGVGAEGERVFLREQCGIPDCHGDGGVCGMAIPVVRRLDPGDSIGIGWDGRTSRTIVDGRCELRETVRPGAYAVEFCWTAQEPDPVFDPIEGPELLGITCQTRRVEFPGTRRVSVLVE